MRWAYALLLMGFFTSASAPVQAQSSDADILFEQGQKAFDAGDYDAACKAFKGSLDAEHALGTLINLARCHKMQGKFATAWREYERVAAEAAREGQQERVDAAGKELAELKAKLSTLTVNASGLPEGATVWLDREVLERRKLGTPTPVDPGTHELRVDASGFQPWSTVLEIGAERDLKTVDVPTLVPVSAPPPETAPAEPGPPAPDDSGSGTLTIVGVVVGGAGVVALVVGGVLGAMTLSEVNEAEEDDALCGPDKKCTEDGRAQIDAAEGKGIGSTILFVAGGAMLVTGVVLVGVDMSSASNDVALVPLAGPEGGGMLLRGRF